MRLSAVLASLLAIGLVQPAFSQTPPTPPAAAAQDQAPPAPLLCTVTTANICAGQGCTKAEALGDLKLPAKLLIHPEHRVLASTSADGFPHISQIMSLAATGKDHVLQGVDHATGWMIHLDEAGTKMTIAISSNEKVLTGAGSCKKPGQPG
jgi:hypothetical protein